MSTPVNKKIVLDQPGEKRLWLRKHLSTGRQLWYVAFMLERYWADHYEIAGNSYGPTPDLSKSPWAYCATTETVILYDAFLDDGSQTV